jgi:lipopolysaccharide transport system ATP-binding protein
MTKPIISVENLGKRYRVKRPGSRGGGGLRHAIEAGAASLWNGLSRIVQGRAPYDRIAPEDEFWALKDINFEVQAGECVGIIGRNGAGKSTLLKILSRITEPSTGRAVLRGRVGSLLEVGTGFHPELTGRENIFLNGAILGMRRHEINKRMDEIVAFAEVDEFLDTPVKHYSSGMYMRLAFAVAAHLDPEILIVDEVLAVGDSHFQKKCLGKMSEVTRDGRTVLFVSHNMAMIIQLCTKVVWLNKGFLAKHGPTDETIKNYMSEFKSNSIDNLLAYGKNMPGNDYIKLKNVQTKNNNDQQLHYFGNTEKIKVYIEFEINKNISGIRFAIRLTNEDGVVVFTTTDQDNNSINHLYQPGTFTKICIIQDNLLNLGEYYITVSVDKPFIDVIFHEEKIQSFVVEQSGGVNGRYPEKWPGVICLPLQWISKDNNQYD